MTARAKWKASESPDHWPCGACGSMRLVLATPMPPGPNLYLCPACVRAAHAALEKHEVKRRPSVTPFFYPARQGDSMKRRNVTSLPPNWSWTWRGDSALDIWEGWEANCPHGVGHSLGIHGCDGCCGHPGVAHVLWENATRTPPRAGGPSVRGPRSVAAGGKAKRSAKGTR